MSPIIRTSEQQALIDWAASSTTGHAVLEARAGSGKTTTLLELADTIIARDAHSTILIVAFNKRIADEITNRAQARRLYLPRVRINTLHACGNSARMSLSEYRRSTLNKHKTSDLLGEYITELARKYLGGNLVGITGTRSAVRPGLSPEVDPDFVTRNKLVIEQLIDFGRLYGVGLEQGFQLEDIAAWETIIQRHITLPRAYTATSSRVSLIPDLLFHACELIKRSEARASDQHDFIDMLWLPALSGAVFHQYDWVLVDEAQDTNTLSRAISLASCAPDGRMVVIGDPHQCINGFQGADSDGIDILRKHLGATVFPLTVSQRCASAITAHARNQTACKDIRSRDDAPAGSVQYTDMRAFDWLSPDVSDAIMSKTGAVLCRNNAPLLSLGFMLMRQGIPFHIAGGTDLYGQLLRLASRWKVPDADALVTRLKTHKDAETARLKSIMAAAARIDAVADSVDMLLSVIEDMKQVSPDTRFSQAHVLQRITALKDAQEADASGLLLSTIHKAKGLEWDTVWLLGADRLMPSRFANTAFDKEQEDHIRYVAITRARSRLVYIDYGAAAGIHDQAPFDGTASAEFLKGAV